MTKETKRGRYLVIRAKINQPVTKISFQLPVLALTNIAATYVTLLNSNSRHAHYTIRHFFSKRNVLHTFHALDIFLTYTKCTI